MIRESEAKKLKETQKNILAQRKLVEVSFMVPKIAIVVSHTKERKESNLIVVSSMFLLITSKYYKLNVESLGVTFVQRTYDMQAKLILHGISLEDCIQSQGPSFRYLATSHLLEDSDDEDHLISISYQMLDRDSPSYSGVESIIDIQFNSFHLIPNPHTISALIDFGLNEILPLQPVANT